MPIPGNYNIVPQILNRRKVLDCKDAREAFSLIACAENSSAQQNKRGVIAAFPSIFDVKETPHHKRQHQALYVVANVSYVKGNVFSSVFPAVDLCLISTSLHCAPRENLA